MARRKNYRYILKIQPPEVYRIKRDQPITLDILNKLISDHAQQIRLRDSILKDAYETKYDILDITKYPKKDYWKPDNRLAVNFAKRLTDTFVGFFAGIPAQISADNETINKYLQLVNAYNDIDDHDAELAKLTDEFGRAYEMLYVDEDGAIGVMHVSPIDAFMVYDDSVLERKRAFVRIYVDDNGNTEGSVSTEDWVRHFALSPTLRWTDEEKIHGFAGVPAVEYRQNEERIGLYEPVMTLINAYNKALSEKGDDVEYFADAYLKILGAMLDENTVKNIRQNRIINFKGTNADKLIVEFMEKPNGDETQEHFLDRLERLIFEITGVPNISEDSFGTSSGIAIKYKMTPMSNLGLTKARKFKAGFNERYRLIFSNPVNSMGKNDWLDINYVFTQNFPANLLEESQIAQNLTGVISKETQMKVLSIVDDPKAELKKIAADGGAAQEITEK
jgi:SPP1 family phage portal protein